MQKYEIPVNWVECESSPAQLLIHTDLNYSNYYVCQTKLTSTLVFWNCSNCISRCSRAHYSNNILQEIMLGSALRASQSLALLRTSMHSRTTLNNCGRFEICGRSDGYGRLMVLAILTVTAVCGPLVGLIVWILSIVSAILTVSVVHLENLVRFWCFNRW